jgi:hypothetical protein
MVFAGPLSMYEVAHAIYQRIQQTKKRLRSSFLLGEEQKVGGRLTLTDGHGILVQWVLEGSAKQNTASTNSSYTTWTGGA